jgi:hypothetical protein
MADPKEKAYRRYVASSVTPLSREDHVVKIEEIEALPIVAESLTHHDSSSGRHSARDGDSSLLNNFTSALVPDLPFLSSFSCFIASNETLGASFHQRIPLHLR